MCVRDGGGGGAGGAFLRHERGVSGTTSVESLAAAGVELGAANPDPRHTQLPTSVTYLISYKTLTNV